MAFSKTLGKYLSPKQNQRLSIAEIHRLWNAEQHQAAGRIPYTYKDPQTPTDNESLFDPTVIKALVENISNIGKWQDEKGDAYANDQIDFDLIELIQQGELRAYPGKDATVAPIPAEELQHTNLRPETSKYFIDREELGCFLAKHGHTLPAFWYEPGDETIYLDKLATRRESVTEQREQLKAVLAEKEQLERDLLNARPFMDPEHPFFAPELEAAVAVWLEMFNHKQEGEIVADKPKMGLWLEENRHEQLGVGGKGINKAIDRIVTVANYRKIPGRPRKRKLF